MQSSVEDANISLVNCYKNKTHLTELFMQNNNKKFCFIQKQNYFR